MQIAVIGTHNGWSSEKLADAVAARTGNRILVEMDKVRIDFGNGRAYSGDINLMNMDAIIIKKVGSRYSPDLLDRLEVLRFVNNAGVPVFSAPERLIRVVNRLSCTVTMQSAGIPMPETTITENVDEAVNAVLDYGKAIIKPLYTSKARGMLLIEAGHDVRRIIETYKKDNSVLYLQKKIEIREQDMGIAFLGGRYLTTYARKKQNDSWNTTIRSGGRYIAFDPSEALIELASSAQSLFGLDFTCVDVAETDEGPVVFEVSAFGGFRGIDQTRDLNPAALYVDYVIRRISNAD